MESYGILSLLPPLVAIALALITREVVASLFIGIFVGSTILAGWNPLIGLFNVFQDFVVPSIANSWNAAILVQVVLFGILIVYLQNNGGAEALGNFISKKMKSKKSLQIFAWLFGIMIFFSDYFNAMTVGSTFRPLADKMKVSREKLAYITDSTSSAVCLLVPFSAWIAYIIGLIGSSFESIGVNESAYLAYIKTIPFNSYCILAVAMVGIVAATGLDFGPMDKAEKRVQNGKLLREGANPISSKEITEAKYEVKEKKISSFAIPLLVLIVSILPLLLWDGNYGEVGFVEAIGQANGSLCLVWAVLLACLTAITMGFIQKTFDFKQTMELVADGAKGMSITYLILVLAWSIGGVTGSMGTSGFIVEILEGTVPGFIIPALVFLTGAIISFSTGTAYGTFAILIPIAIPLASEMGINIYPVIAAALSGGVFGDHCSPISDTTVLSSTGASCDHIDHVTTQLPYALTVAGVAIVGYIVAGLFNSVLITLAVSFVLLFVVTKVLHNITQDKEDEKAA